MLQKQPEIWCSWSFIKRSYQNSFSGLEKRCTTNSIEFNDNFIFPEVERNGATVFKELAWKLSLSHSIIYNLGSCLNIKYGFPVFWQKPTVKQELMNASY